MAPKKAQGLDAERDANALSSNVKTASTAEELAAVHAAFCASTASRLDSAVFGRNLPTPAELDQAAENLAKLFKAEEFACRSEKEKDKVRGYVSHIVGGAFILWRNEPAPPPDFVPAASLPAIRPLLAPEPEVAADELAAGECLPFGISLEYVFAAYDAVSIGALARKWAAAKPQNSETDNPRELWPKMLACFSSRELFSLLLWGLLLAQKIKLRRLSKPQYCAGVFGYLLVRDGAGLFEYGKDTVRLLGDEVAKHSADGECYRMFCTAYIRTFR